MQYQRYLSLWHGIQYFLLFECFFNLQNNFELDTSHVSLDDIMIRTFSSQNSPTVPSRGIAFVITRNGQEVYCPILCEPTLRILLYFTVSFFVLNVVKFLLCKLPDTQGLLLMGDSHNVAYFRLVFLVACYSWAVKGSGLKFCNLQNALNIWLFFNFFPSSVLETFPAVTEEKK